MRTLTDFTGNAIYLDTMLPYIFLRSIDPATKDFFKRIESGEFLAYTSVLTFDELAYRLLLAFIKDHYDGSPLEHYRNDEMKIMAEFAPRVSYSVAPPARLSKSCRSGRGGCRPGYDEQRDATVQTPPARCTAFRSHATGRMPGYGKQ